MSIVVLTQCGPSINMHKELFRTTFFNQMREVLRRHEPDETIPFDLECRTSKEPANTVTVTVCPNSPMSDAYECAKDLQAELAEVVHRFRGWQHFVDVTVKENDATWTCYDWSPYRNP